MCMDPSLVGFSVFAQDGLVHCRADEKGPHLSPWTG